MIPYSLPKNSDKGSGLGMAIVKLFIDRFQGEISNSNNEDGGASFTLRFKTAASKIIICLDLDNNKYNQYKKLNSNSLIKLRPMNILIVDDDKSSGSAVADFVEEQLGHKIKLCHNGNDALEICPKRG